MISSSPLVHAQAAAPRSPWCDVDPASRVLRLHGEFDLGNADMLAQACSELLGVCVDGGTPATVDAQRLAFIDAAGIGVLVGLHDSLREYEVRLRLVNPRANVRRVLAICRLTGLFELPSEAAERNLARRGGCSSSGARP